MLSGDIEIVLIGFQKKSQIYIRKEIKTNKKCFSCVLFLIPNKVVFLYVQVAFPWDLFLTCQKIFAFVNLISEILFFHFHLTKNIQSTMSVHVG